MRSRRPVIHHATKTVCSTTQLTRRPGLFGVFRTCAALQPRQRSWRSGQSKVRSFGSQTARSVSEIGIFRQRSELLIFGMLLVRPIIPHPSDNVMDSAPVVSEISVQCFLSKVP